MHSILLVGAALVGVPILLHLIMKQEPKRLIFPALRFLQQRRRTNQRKMRLRHFLLLALRVLLIALFCLALYQPIISGDLRLVNLSGEQPVAAVVILDTSPSMAYRQNNVTRLEEARRRAVEFLEDLPAGSRVAVLEAGDPLGSWENSPADARKRLEGITQTRGVAAPMTAALPVAYQLFKTLEQEAGTPEPLPRIVALFSDRTAASWESARLEELARLRDAVPSPKPSHLYVDVGAESPANVGILAAEIRPQLLTANMPAVITVTVQAEGADVPSCEVVCLLDDATTPERQEKPLTAGSPQSFQFKFEKLLPGFHKAVFRIRDDNLASDNERTVIFAVAAPRKLLAVADAEWDAAFWRLSHEQHREFTCDVIKPAAVESFAGYEAVCLINVVDPTQATRAGKPLWEVLKAYVEAGGKLLVAPGELKATELLNYTNPAEARELLPGKLDRVKDWSLEPPPKPLADPSAPRPPDRRFGVVWKVDSPRDTVHPMLAPFNEWRLKGNVNVLRNPRPAVRYWLVEKHPEASAIVYYDDDDDESRRNPAVLERSVGKGRVVMLTTRIDPQDDETTRWNEYWATTESAWPVVFPNLLARYLAGSPSEAIYNFPTGAEVTLPLPPAQAGKPRQLILEGPGISGRDATPEVGESQIEYRLPRGRTESPGAYTLRNEDRSWEQRFSLHVPAEESTLAKVPEPAIEGLFGPNTVVPVSKDIKLRDVLETKFNQPLSLFPGLLLLVLLLFMLEGLFANRFYRPRSAP